MTKTRAESPDTEHAERARAAAEAEALSLHRPGDPASLRALFALRREASPKPPPPPFLDELNAELDRRQAIGRDPDPRQPDEAGLANLGEKAEAGDADAGYFLGRVLLRGEHPEENAALAALLRAAAAGHAAAAFHAGTLLFHGWGVPPDVPRALALLETSARAGNADAARFLGLAYDGFGGILPKDHDTALRWWYEAAHLGDSHGCWVVGQHLLAQSGDREARERGCELVVTASERGFPLACGFLGLVEADDFETDSDPERFDENARPLLRLGAVRGDFKAARRLAECLWRLGGEERYEEAVYWLRSASRGDATAARLLADHYFSGCGIPRSDDAGTAWLALAAEQGDAMATARLAWSFLRGRGVPADPEAAVLLAERAAAAGCGRGALILGAMYDDGLGVPRDGVRAVAWFERAAELGEPEAMSLLANVLFDGRGVDPDPARAVELLKRSASPTDENANHLLALMLFRGEGVAPDPALARTYFLRAGDRRHLPSLFTTLDEEALRYRPAAAQRRDLRDAIAEMAADPEALAAAAALDLGLLYWNADAGLTEDEARAEELLRLAATKGSALAAACLSHVLRWKGDYDGEMDWLEEAARAGLPGAQSYLAVRLVQTGRATGDDDLTLHLLESAAGRGDVRACAALVCRLGGLAETPDPVAAERIRALKRCAREGGYEGEEFLES